MSVRQSSGQEAEKDNTSGAGYECSDILSAFQRKAARMLMGEKVRSFLLFQEKPLTNSGPFLNIQNSPYPKPK